MRRCSVWLLAIVLVHGLVQAQTPRPTTNYRLHAEKERLPSTLIYLLPDQTLLVLIPQEQSKWVLKRLTAWHTPDVKEDTLTFTGQPSQVGDSGFTEIKVNLAGTFAVVRVRPWSSMYAPLQSRSPATIVLIDLHNFTIVSQFSTTDPLLSASEWSFSKEGLLIASALSERSSIPAQLKHPWEYQSLTDTYQAGTFMLPSWKPTMTCDYERLLDFPNGRDAPSVWHLTKESSGCAALIEAAHVITADHLPGGEFPPLRYADLGRPCMLAGESPSGHFAFYGCRTGNGYLDDMIVTTKTRSVVVLSVPDGKQVLAVPLPHNTKPYPALLADAEDHTWLILLRDGITLETYRLP